jgi:uncharacterized protein (TIGR02271 family)
MAVGALTGGPVGAVVGAIAAGGVAGGYAGKGVGELIDPTTEDNWLREYWNDRDDETRRVAVAKSHEDYRPAYRYGLGRREEYAGKPFDAVETDLRSGWEKARGDSRMTWEEARGAVRHAFDRTIQLKEEHLTAHKTPVKAGEVEVRKEVHTEHKTIQVPVEREEVVIERRPAGGTAATGDIRAEEIRIPVKEEKVNVTKEAVVKEEVSVGKRKVADTKTVGGTVRHEEVKVETTGDARVRDTGK